MKKKQKRKKLTKGQIEWARPWGGSGKGAKARWEELRDENPIQGPRGKKRKWFRGFLKGLGEG